MAEQSSSYSTITENIENTEIRVCPVVPTSGAKYRENRAPAATISTVWNTCTSHRNLLPFRPKYVVVNQKKSEETVWSAYS